MSIDVTSTATAAPGETLTSTTYRLLAADGTTVLSTAAPPYSGHGDGLLFIEQTVTQSGGQQDEVTIAIAGVVMDLAAVAASASAINLAWSDPGGATAFDIHASQTQGFTAGAGNRIVQNHATLSYQHTGLGAEETWYYQVIAKNASGATTAGNETTATTEAAGGGAFVVDFLGTTSSRAESTAAQSDISALVNVLSAKIRFDGDWVTRITDGGSPSLLKVGSTQGGRQKLDVRVTDWDATNVRFTVEVVGLWDVNLDVARASFSAGTYYRLYAQAAKANSPGVYLGLYQDNGTLIGQVGGTQGTFNDLPAGGFISVGGNTVALAGRGRTDGIAIYNTALTGTDRYATPTTGDTGILGLWGFNEGTGSTVGNAVSGGVSMALQGVENTAWAWVSGGAW